MASFREQVEEEEEKDEKKPGREIVEENETTLKKLVADQAGARMSHHVWERDFVLPEGAARGSIVILNKNGEAIGWSFPSKPQTQPKAQNRSRVTVYKGSKTWSGILHSLSDEACTLEMRGRKSVASSSSGDEPVSRSAISYFKVRNYDHVEWVAYPQQDARPTVLIRPTKDFPLLLTFTTSIFSWAPTIIVTIFRRSPTALAPPTPKSSSRESKGEVKTEAKAKATITLEAVVNNQGPAIDGNQTAVELVTGRTFASSSNDYEMEGRAEESMHAERKMSALTSAAPRGGASSDPVAEDITSFDAKDQKFDAYTTTTFPLFSESNISVSKAYFSYASPSRSSVSFAYRLITPFLLPAASASIFTSSGTHLGNTALNRVYRPHDTTWFHLGPTRLVRASHEVQDSYEQVGKTTTSFKRWTEIRLYTTLIHSTLTTRELSPEEPRLRVFIHASSYGRVVETSRVEVAFVAAPRTEEEEDEKEVKKPKRVETPPVTSVDGKDGYWITLEAHERAIAKWTIVSRMFI